MNFNNDILSTFGLQLEDINKSFDEQIYKIAKEKIKSVASILAKDYKAYDQNCFANVGAMLEIIAERNPFENTRFILDFNRQVTKQACIEVLKDNSIDIISQIAIYSTIVELGAREFVNPNNTNEFLIHLSAAKDNGFFFTPASIAIRMVLASLEYAPNAQTSLDPSCGGGIFLAYQVLFNKKLVNVKGIELNEDAVVYATNLLKYVCEYSKREIKVSVIHKNFFDYFRECNKDERFDVIVMNPPYGSIKFHSSDLTDKGTRAVLASKEHKELQVRLRNETLLYAAHLREELAIYGIGKGVLEYSKLFMAATKTLLTDENGVLVAITPSTWLGDETSISFRKNLIESNTLHELWIFPEAAKLFKGVNQPTVVSIICKYVSGGIRISNSLLSVMSIRENIITLDNKTILSVAGDKCKIPKCDDFQLNLLARLSSQKKFKDNNRIINARGELDVTQYSQYISENDTGHRLIRGDHIQGCLLRHPTESTKKGYVRFEEFCALPGKQKFIQSNIPRIAITQCSYLQKAKRIEAAIIPAGSILANSCNYISLKAPCDDEHELIYYWMVINSSIIEWQFRIFSYNNHVGNGEIDELFCPDFSSLPIELKQNINKINSSSVSQDEIILFDVLFARLFGLKANEYSVILRSIGDSLEDIKMKKITQMEQEEARTQKITVPNHLVASLSELDKLMISYIKPGDNWTSIPESLPSKRLDQIRAMAKTRGMVRTTFYSRLKYDQPAYTISTYYNRPGNGANIHPWENRTLSAREAARLQSFPDSFVFEGREAEVRKQIGNAVPPLLGYAIGKAIALKNKQMMFCDLFAGAGGLSYGLELAGFKGIAALEIDKAAAKTYARNHSSLTNTIVGDINDPIIQQELIHSVENTIGNEKWVMVGGPPCQGFSTAGYRNENDDRNKLVFSYLNLIERLHPNIVVMENVPGILSMSKGLVIKGIYSSLTSLGYYVIDKPLIVSAEMFGVPQMRKRVIIIASLDKDTLPTTLSPLFAPCLGRRETEKDKASLFYRYPISVGEALYDLPEIMPSVSEFRPNTPIDTTYSEWCRGKISVEEMLNRRSQIK